MNKRSKSFLYWKKAWAWTGLPHLDNTMVVAFKSILNGDLLQFRKNIPTVPRWTSKMTNEKTQPEYSYNLIRINTDFPFPPHAFLNVSTRQSRSIPLMYPRATDILYYSFSAAQLQYTSFSSNFLLLHDSISQTCIHVGLHDLYAHLLLPYSIFPVLFFFILFL